MHLYIHSFFFFLYSKFWLVEIFSSLIGTHSHIIYFFVNLLVNYLCIVIITCLVSKCISQEDFYALNRLKCSKQSTDILYGLQFTKNKCINIF